MRNISLEELAKLFNDGFPFDRKLCLMEQTKLDIFNGRLILSSLNDDYKLSGGTIFAYKGNLTITPDTPLTNGLQNFAIKSNPGDFNFYFQKSEKNCFIEDSLYAPLIIPTSDKTKKLWLLTDENGKIVY